MNTLRMMMELDALYDTWLKQSKSREIEKPDWVRGVAYGIMLATKTVHYHVNKGVPSYAE